jgi:hypothetical protein
LLADEVVDYYGDQEARKPEDRYPDAVALLDDLKRVLGRIFNRDADKANAFSKLSCYETTIERSLYKALHELQRLQAARYANGNVSPPVAIDVDVSRVSGEQP